MELATDVINEYLNLEDLPFDLMSILKGALVIVGVVLLVALITYILTSVFLSKLNKKLYGKGTILAWLPICRTYLLGKLTFGKLVGWLLIIVSVLMGLKYNGETVIPSNINSIISLVYGCVIIFLWIYAIIKFFKVNKNKTIPQKEASMQIQSHTEPQFIEKEEEPNTPKTSIFENPHIEEELTTKKIEVHDEHVVHKEPEVEEVVSVRPIVEEPVVKETTPEVLTGTQIEVLEEQKEEVKEPELNVQTEVPVLDEALNPDNNTENITQFTEIPEHKEEVSVDGITLDVPDATELSDLNNDQK